MNESFKQPIGHRHWTHSFQWQMPSCIHSGQRASNAKKRQINKDIRQKVLTLFFLFSLFFCFKTLRITSIFVYLYNWSQQIRNVSAIFESGAISHFKFRHRCAERADEWRRKTGDSRERSGMLLLLLYSYELATSLRNMKLFWFFLSPMWNGIVHRWQAWKRKRTECWHRIVPWPRRMLTKNQKSSNEKVVWTTCPKRQKSCALWSKRNWMRLVSTPDWSPQLLQHR